MYNTWKTPNNENLKEPTHTIPTSAPPPVRHSLVRIIPTKHFQIIQPQSNCCNHLKYIHTIILYHWTNKSHNSNFKEFESFTFKTLENIAFFFEVPKFFGSLHFTSTESYVESTSDSHTNFYPAVLWAAISDSDDIIVLVNRLSTLHFYGNQNSWS